MAVDVRGFGRREVAHRVGDIFDRAAHAGRDERAHLVVVHRYAAAAHVRHAGAKDRLRVRPEAGRDGTWAYAVHRDAARAVGDRHLPREAYDAVLGRNVRRAAAGPVQSGHRRHVDDASAAARQHLAQRALAHQEDAGEVDVDHLAPYGGVHLVDIEVAVKDAGV